MSLLNESTWKSRRGAYAKVLLTVCGKVFSTFFFPFFFSLLNARLVFTWFHYIVCMYVKSVYWPGIFF